MTSDVTIQPPAVGWPARPMATSGLARATRVALGLPDDRVVVMSGHQAQLWHAGIAAKAFAGAHVAHSVGGVSAWISVDQDATDAGAIAYPTATMRTATWRLDAGSVGATRRAELPAIGLRGAEKVLSPVPGDMHASARTAAEGVLTTLRKHADKPTLAAQFNAAAFAPLAGLAEMDVQCGALTLSHTPIFESVLALMQADPLACAQRYNAAVAGVPAARLRALLVHDTRVEVPLWRVRPGLPRSPVFAHDLATLPREQLAPRALLMTAMLRAAACDVFIHGVGGGVYDQATDVWWRAWLADASHAAGQSLRELTLAPTAVVTATRRLHFPGVQVPTPAEIDASVWRAHRARHDVSALGPAASTRKQELLEAIAQASRRSPQRRGLYRELHRLIAQARERSASVIAEAREAAQIALQSREIAQTAHARTWPCAFLPRATLEELCYSIGRALSS